MNEAEKSFVQSLNLCETLLRDEKKAIEASDAEAIDAILARKEEAFKELSAAGEKIDYSPTEKPEFASRIESIFLAQQDNLELMGDVLSQQNDEATEIRHGQARLRMVKGAYLPSSTRGDRSLN
ncbi:MAG: hypothetical protein CMI31_03260 [Opitutae bacterium]|nr:hypothetical protein [Opitutae bacterium]|tara:strand:- start:25 stop:396 length:372 start_codon:yes stop_codon:yes gene_type:complete